MRLALRGVLMWFSLLAGAMAWADAPQWSVYPLRIYTEDRPPFNYLGRDGEVTGVSTEIVRAALKQAGMDAPILVFPWARSFSLARTRPNSLVFSIVRSPAREKQFVWLGALMSSDDWLYRAAGHHTIAPSSFAEVKACCQICVVNKDVSEEILQRQGAVRGQNYIVADSYNDCARLVQSNTVSFLIDSHFDQDGAVEKKLHGSSVALEPVMPLSRDVPDAQYLAANPDTSPEVIARLQQALQQLQNSGQIDRIKRQFFERFKRQPAPVSP